MIEIRNNDIKKIRIVKLFIEATAQIIDEEGIEEVTIRKIAKITGYNSATIYNYFDNCNQLISFAAMKFISDYVQALPDYISKTDNPLDQAIAVWECFCNHCFKKPKIYYAIFTANIGDKSENLIRDYYNLFPEELGNPPQDLVPMLMESNFSKRCEKLLKPCIQEGYFTPEKAEEINELIRLVYQGMLSLIINNRLNYSTEEAIEQTMKHIKTILKERVTTSKQEEI